LLLTFCFEYSDKHWTSFDGLQIVARQWLLKPAADQSSEGRDRVDDNIKGSVLLLHGIGDHSGRFEHVASFLNRAGYSVLIPDLRGHGRSQGSRGYIRDFATLNQDIDDALKQTRALHPDRPCFLYGHSMGGLAALYFALDLTARQDAMETRKPDGLVVTSPALRILADAPAWKLVLGKAIRNLFPALSMDSGLDIQELSDNPQVAERIQSDRFRHGKITPAAYFGMLETGAWCLKHAGGLAVPTLLMHGKSDRITDHAASIEFAESATDCQLVLWDHGKHELHNMTFGDDVLCEITRFQSRCIREGFPNTG